MCSPVSTPWLALNPTPGVGLILGLAVEEGSAQQEEEYLTT